MDLRPGGPADMAMAPDADGRRAKLDPVVILTVVGEMKNHTGQLTRAFKAARGAGEAEFLWAFSHLGDVAIIARDGGAAPRCGPRRSQPRGLRANEEFAGVRHDGAQAGA